ncbi:unnamed protein product [Kluyveromyces dobzhanskii CBS 2104]|uniref:WGS project CCBQ000000000 data, contig 00106 n=1 Tax=Kluyveromyces dobzhanskii CBS 2104 TaxID=1427455 RepID=A0A0A8L8K8_9SACH|nr:unnamed protein product [Kluyveromyces dobzhanskii CBS 2104]
MNNSVPNMVPNVDHDAGINSANSSNGNGNGNGTGNVISQSNTKSVKRRVAKACDRCRKRKIKCDDLDPVSGKCSNCIKYRVACTFHYHEEMMRRVNLKAENRRPKFPSGSSKSGGESNSDVANDDVDDHSNHNGSTNTEILNHSPLKSSGSSSSIPRISGSSAGHKRAADCDETPTPSLEPSAVYPLYSTAPMGNSMYQQLIPFNDTNNNNNSSSSSGNNAASVNGALPRSSVADMAPAFGLQNPVLLPQHNQYPQQAPNQPLKSHQQQHQPAQLPFGQALSQPVRSHTLQNGQHKDLNTGQKKYQFPGPDTKSSDAPGRPLLSRDLPNEPAPDSSLEGMHVKEQLSVLGHKMDVLGRKTTLLMDWYTKLDWIGRQCEALVNKTEQAQKVDEVKGRKSEVYAARKRYNACQYTELTLLWLRAKICPEMEKEEYLRPMRPVKNMVSKWYFVQMKRLVHNISNESHLRPLPDATRCQRIMEIYFNLLASDDLNVIEPVACQAAFEKYFSSDPKDIPHSEHLMVNVLVALGCLYTRHSLMESSHYRKDRLDFTPEKLFQIENDCYQNALFYYHKISLVSEGILSIQGLLLFYTYIKASISSEAALNVFVVAVKFARDLELSYLDNFNHLPREEFLQIRSIWLFCYLNDSSIAMTLGKPPIINESDMSVAFGRNYFKTLKADCAISRSPDTDVLEAMKDESLVVDWIKKNPWYFSVILNYFRACLCKISNKIIRYLFSIDATSVWTFDEIVNKIKEIKSDLVEFSDNMPIYLNQDNQRTFLARIYHELAESQTIVDFKLMSVLITEITLKKDSLIVTLSNFTQAFFSDNRDIIGNGIRPDCDELAKYFDVAKVQAFKSSLNASKAIDFKDYTILHYKQNVFHDFFTVVLSVSFYVINNIDSSASFELLCMLKDLHYRLTDGGTTSEIHIYRDIKWLVSIFLLSFQLEMASIHYKNKNTLSYTYPMDDDRYRQVMKEITVYVSHEANQITALFNSERAAMGKEGDVLYNAGKMPKWALLKPFGPPDDSTEEMLHAWWDNEIKKQATKVTKENNLPDGIAAGSKDINGKNKTNNSEEYELGFNFNERWLPADLRFFGQDNYISPVGRNTVDVNFIHPTALFEDISSLNR